MWASRPLARMADSAVHLTGKAVYQPQLGGTPVWIGLI
jgi:hypothetical protein